ncbi:MAG: ArsR/SmtB family transcription factor [Gaiellaceae bacterium]
MNEDRCGLLALDLVQAENLRLSLPSSDALEGAADRAKALGDPTRLRIALALRDGSELCVCDLAWVCERWEKTVSHHARALRVAGLAEARRDGKMMMYSLTDAGRALLEAVLEEEEVWT